MNPHKSTKILSPSVCESYESMDLLMKFDVSQERCPRESFWLPILPGTMPGHTRLDILQLLGLYWRGGFTFGPVMAICREKVLWTWALLGHIFHLRHFSECITSSQGFLIFLWRHLRLEKMKSYNSLPSGLFLTTIHSWWDGLAACTSSQGNEFLTVSSDWIEVMSPSKV